MWNNDVIRDGMCADDHRDRVIARLGDALAKKIPPTNLSPVNGSFGYPGPGRITVPVTATYQ